MSERSRSRSPVRGTDEDCYLFVGNFPDTWNLQKIQVYLKKTITAHELYANQIVYIYLLKYTHNNEDVFKGECVVQFLTATACKAAFEALNGAEVEGKKLEIIPKAKQMVPVYKWKGHKMKSKLENEGKKEEKMKMFDPDKFRKHETYGLSMKFLSDLCIVPPLTNKIFISNLSTDVTETKLREIFSYAGHVVAASLTQKCPDKKVGKVLFDHPVEAVQAISMFHNKELYSRPMFVKLDKWKQSPIVPEGLNAVGLGLGPNGEPMTGVRHTIELEPLKQLLMQELKKLQQFNRSQFNQSGPDNTPNQNMNMGSNNPMSDMNAGNPMNSLLQILQQNIGGNMGTLGMAMQQACNNQNIPNQVAFNNQNSFGNQVAQQPPTQSRFDVPPSGLTQMVPMVSQNDLAQQYAAYQQNANIWQTQQAALRSCFDIPPSGLTTQNVGSNVGQSWTAGNWSQAQTPSQTSSFGDDSGYGQPKVNTDDFDVQRLSDMKKPETKTSDMLLFINLPASVTPKALINKMKEVGALKFAEITGQGRAIVRFQDPSDAHRCLKLYDRSKVDGQIITVKFV